VVVIRVRELRLRAGLHRVPVERGSGLAALPGHDGSWGAPIPIAIS